MGVITGINAAIDGLTCLEQFVINTEGEDNAVACGDSKGAVVRGDTNLDWSGAAVGYGHTPPKMPGELFTLTASDRVGQGWKSSANGAIVDRVKIFCNPSEAELFYYHIWFSGNGSLTTGAYAATSSATPGGTSSKDRILKIGNTSQTGIGYWDLDIIGNNTDPLWVGGGGGWPNRGAGNIDATITWRQHFDAIEDMAGSGLARLGSFTYFKLYVTATLYWDLKWMEILKLPTKYVIRNQQNKPEYVVTNGEAKFSAYYGVPSVIGWINRPAVPQPTRDYWPPAT